MTKADRVRAFSMRCDGMTWEQIGEALHYDGGSIAKDLRTALASPRKAPYVRFPAVRRFLDERCDNSIQIFAGMIGVSPHRLRRVLVYGDAPSKSLRRKIAQATGLPEGEVFSVGPCEMGGAVTCTED
ncbi:MAG: hypothetical protein ACI3V3_04130 [Faecousia sp.]